jgi:hypothetical protein
MDSWQIAIISYVSVALFTLFPTAKALLLGVKLNPGGVTFNECNHFSQDGKKLLSDHYSRIYGTLGFWKKRASIYTSFHYYCVIWTILSAWAVPLISAVAPQIQGSNAKWLIVAISSHVALSLSFHRGLKVGEGMKAFRHGESEFYDLYRRLLDRPQLFGETEKVQIDKYFEDVEKVRKLVRAAETESIPEVDSIKQPN